MFHSVCPYEDWASVARDSCGILEQFHFLRDEYGNTGGVCSVPIWVEKDRCPVYNNKAKKLDTFACLNRTCPSIDYRSNEIHVENYCKYSCDYESSTIMSTISQNEGNHVKFMPFVLGALSLLDIIVSLVILAIVAIAVHHRKRKSVQKRDEYAIPRVENKNDEFSDESRQLVEESIGQTNEVDASKYRGNNSSNMQLLEYNNFANSNNNHQTTDPKERRNGKSNKEDQLNGPPMDAKIYSKDDDIVVINCIEEVSKTNDT